MSKESNHWRRGSDRENDHGLGNGNKKNGGGALMQNSPGVKFSRIKGVSDIRRLPRLGKIRLGVKAIGKSGKEHPVETAHFVVPPEVAAVYGQEPKELDVMFPVDDPEVIFPQRLCWFGESRGLQCVGDGERAMRINVAGVFENRECPCPLLEQKKCRRMASLLVILPKVNMGGVYQIDISSYHSIVDLNSGIDYVRCLVGRVARIPLKLRRVPRETHGSGRKEIHFCVQLTLDATFDQLNKIIGDGQRLLPGASCAPPSADLSNPPMDDGPVENGQEETTSASPGPGPGQAVEDPVEAKFKAVMPAGTDQARLEQFMEACGHYYKQTRGEVMESALVDPDEFFRTFGTWVKKHFGDEVQCPERGKNSAAACSGCASHKGCPAWD